MWLHQHLPVMRMYWRTDVLSADLLSKGLETTEEVLSGNLDLEELPDDQ